MNIGLLYFFAVGGLGVVGLMMAGWSSFNKYSLLGGLRAAAQIVSYELPLHPRARRRGACSPGTLSASTASSRARPAASWTGTSSSSRSAFLIFFIAATAEGSRTPFDLTEADSEIVAGFATEYSGMRFGFFFFAEYVNVFILSALTVVLFLGGWNAPFDLAARSSTASSIATPSTPRSTRPAWASGLLWIVAARRRPSSSWLHRGCRSGCSRATGHS